MMKKNYTIEIRERDGGIIKLRTDKVVAQVSHDASEYDREELIREAEMTAALANKIVPVEVEDASS